MWFIVRLDLTNLQVGVSIVFYHLEEYNFDAIRWSGLNLMHVVKSFFQNLHSVHMVMV